MLNTQKDYISSLFTEALKEIGAPETAKVILEKPKQAAHGDVACTVALQCAKAMKKAPRDIAAQLVDQSTAGYRDILQKYRNCRSGLHQHDFVRSGQAGSGEDCFRRRYKIRLSSNRQR